MPSNNWNLMPDNGIQIIWRAIVEKAIATYPNIERYLDKRLWVYTRNKGSLGLTETKYSFGATRGAVYRGDYSKVLKCAVALNQVLVDGYNKDPDKWRDSVTSTLIHEMGHIIVPTGEHSWQWEEAANRLCKVCALMLSKPIHISRCASDEESDLFESLIEHKYIIRCTKCSQEYYRDRSCRLVEHPNYYNCGSCGGELKPKNYTIYSATGGIKVQNTAENK